MNTNIISVLANMKRNEDLIMVLKNVAENRNLGFMQKELMTGLKYLKDAVMYKELYEILEIMFKSSKKEFDEKFFCSVFVKFNFVKQQQLLKIINDNNVSISNNFPSLIINSLVEDNQIKNAIIFFFNLNYISISLLKINNFVIKIFDHNLFIYFYNYFRKFYLLGNNCEVNIKNGENSKKTTNSLENNEKNNIMSSISDYEINNESCMNLDNTDSIDKNEVDVNTISSHITPSQDAIFSYYIEDEANESQELNDIDINTMNILEKIESNIRNNQTSCENQALNFYFNENISEVDLDDNKFIKINNYQLNVNKELNYDNKSNHKFKFKINKDLETDICEAILSQLPK